jgi:hypothetical protein
MDALHKQIQDTYKQAWYDLLREKVASEPPDFDWIVNLYKEIREKLTYFLKKGSRFRVEIEEGMDVEIFDQMIRHGAFKGPEFEALVTFVFDKSLKLGSAGRDKDTNALRKEVIDALYNGAPFSELVPVFFKNANIVIDWLHEDFSNIKKNLEH